MLFVRCTFRQNVYTDWQRSIASNGDMSGPIKLAFKHVFQFYVAVYIILSWFSLAKFKATAAEINDHTKLFPEQNEGNWFSVVFFCIYLFLSLSPSCSCFLTLSIIFTAIMRLIAAKVQQLDMVHCNHTTILYMICISALKRGRNCHLRIYQALFCSSFQFIGY